MDIRLDTRDFDAKMQRLVQRTVPALVEKGLARAMLALLNDCVMEPPTVPLKEGWLRGSASIFVQNQLVAISPHGRPGKAATAHAAPLRATAWVGVIGFNTPYAARLHEGISFTFTEPSAGPKFLEAKMQRHRASYMQEIADTIREGGETRT
jgi:hypothetical protein